MIGLGEKTGSYFSVGSKADAAAVAAEGTRYRSDNAYFAEAIVKGETSRGLADVIWGELN